MIQVSIERQHLDICWSYRKRGHLNLLGCKPGGTNVSLSIFREDQAEDESISQEKRDKR